MSIRGRWPAGRRRHGLAQVVIPVVLAVGTACGGGNGAAPTEVPSRTGTPAVEPTTVEPTAVEPDAVEELTSIGMLRDRFEDDAGSVRLILLISPT